MKGAADNTGLFQALRGVLLPYAGSLEIVTDKADHFYLNTRQLQENRKPHFFGAVQLKKSGVGYHLMPIYTHPRLLRGISAGLKKKMSGKSCFIFDSSDDALLKELAGLTKAAFAEYKKAGYV